MGQEIDRARFERGGLSARGDIGALELETWLVDGEGYPRAVNELFLAHCAQDAAACLDVRGEANREDSYAGATMGSDPLLLSGV